MFWVKIIILVALQREIEKNELSLYKSSKERKTLRDITTYGMAVERMDIFRLELASPSYFSIFSVDCWVKHWRMAELQLGKLIKLFFWLFTYSQQNKAD